ncbi:MULTISPECIES: CZB domain-containing protein [unclassified Oceanobacter]|uniref:CZB domain-containing protein n=2 Tax=Oceanobacter TaxID=196079 RepID=UPI0026E24C5B|nr:MULTISPECIES: CZB domain-containing protein [unclassified Oceanobacter]MDO6681580.1 CZB domain-containing protein [Oceanobacter sp. 5_MG-2023]MDP2505792.1 CZB domain-containing protein [Oceanobacter sp. 3_MG-2023]MDP2608169.1 CZB domain-containing protein [Oceanobacter sp. 1_MG-2023]MDP2612895.1 CZB domain-containing protein [Oceanobacter sp. 2_MG-2023]
MRLMNFFGFGHDHQDAIHAKEAAKRASVSLDIDVSIAAHENWLTRLETYISGHSHETLDPTHAACDDECELGKWIYSDGEKYLGQYAAFNDLKATHKMFHYKASSIISLVQADNHSDAEKELAGDIHKLTLKIRQRLQDLKYID